MTSLLSAVGQSVKRVVAAVCVVLAAWFFFALCGTNPKGDFAVEFAVSSLSSIVLVSIALAICVAGRCAAFLVTGKD